MNLLNKLFRQKEEPIISSDPFWASNFSPAEYKRFIQLVSAYFDQQGKSYKIENGMIFILDQDSSESLSLQNIAQICHQAVPDTWPALIQEHFTLLNKIPPATQNTANSASTFDQTAPYLAVRMWPDGTLDSVGRENLIFREDLPGTISALVCDQPDSVQAVNPKTAEPWGKSVETLFEIGLSNVRSQCKPQRQIKALSQGVNVHVLTSDNFFTATYALLIGEFPDLIGAHGTLFGIPHRHMMVCYPIQGIQVVQAIQQLVPIIGHFFQEGPGSVSPHLYWFSQGKYSAIVFDPHNKSLYIPPEFTEILNQIADQANSQPA